MGKSKAFLAGLMAGLVAALAMTVVMLILARFGVATPLVIIGDRLSVFISPGPFLSLMGRVGGYNHLKQLGVGSTIAGQLIVGSIAGAIFGVVRRKRENGVWTVLILVVLPILAVAILLWPVLGTSYRGLPIDVARFVTLIGFALSVVVFERTLVMGYQFLAHTNSARPEPGFTPDISRRALILSGVGVLIAGGGAGLLRKLYRRAAFSYDGTQYKGAGVQAITPTDQFYCVTKNVIDPRVNIHLWHLEVNGLVQNPATYRFRDLKGFPMVEQETTLMCISNGLGDGLMSNARWKGVALRDLIDPTSPLANAARVRLHGVDNYTDTFPLEKALEATTLIAFYMNGESLPHRHGFPARAIVPGYFGEKHVKWLTRIELATAEAKGFYERQGWGPNFIVPTRSRIDVPMDGSSISLGQVKGAIEVKGVAFGGDRGISRVEVSDDGGESWNPADITYSGGDLAWSLWSFKWQPDDPDNYTLVVRATDDKGALQKVEEERGWFSGVSGFHQISVHVVA